METALSDFRRFLLLILLLSTSVSLKTEVEANVLRFTKPAKIKFGRGVFNTRRLVSNSREDGSGQIVRLDVQSPGTVSNDDTPSPSLHTGPSSGCYPSCVEGVDFYKESVLTCIDYFGIPVHMSECDAAKDSGTKSYSLCPHFGCEEDWSVELKAWTACSESCTTVLENGTITPEAVNREWECHSNAKLTYNADEDCTPLIEKLGLTAERECPVKPCTEYTMQPSDWGPCNCENWIQERTFICVDNTDAKAKHPLTTCENYGLKLGATSRRCLPETKCQSTGLNENTFSEDTFDFCNYYNCSTHGTCKDNKCICEDEEFYGDDCQYDEHEITECIPPSILQGDGSCCESGIYNYTGHCCPGDYAELQLDKNGDCCTSGLDLCGNCNPEEPEFRDIRGACCKVLDAGGFCCPSGEVDECGVCDGLSLTCNTIVSISFQNQAALNGADDCTSALIPELATAMWVKESAIETGTADEGSFTFTATGVNVSSGLLKKKATTEAKKGDVKTSCGTIVSVTVDRSPKCGNNVCEIGEASADSEHYCEKDCTYEISRCEVKTDELGRSVVCNGHGSCSFKDAAVCECFEGYAGDQCEKCQYGFFFDYEGSSCLPRQAFVNGPTYYTPPSPATPSTSTPETPSTSTPETPSTSTPETPSTSTPETPSTSTPSIPSPEESPIASPLSSPEPFVESSLESAPVTSPELPPELAPEPSPEPSLEPPTPEPGSEKVVTKGTTGKDESDDDGGLSKAASIGIAIACCFILFLVLLTFLYYFWLKQPPGTEYTAIPADPATTTAGE